MRLKLPSLVRAATASSLTALLLACGGGGGGSASAPPPPAADGGLDDTTVYSSAVDASLPGAVEASVVTQHSLVLDGQRLDYSATAGHLIAREPSGAQRAEAKMFYVAYTVATATPATRPVTFLYNGGPGSASVWLKLGSFGPKRLVTGVPETTLARPFTLVDNADSLLGQTDLVFVNAIGSGRSQAIAPFTNRSFWGVDKDAEVFRDFILRYLQVNNRLNSPKFLYGESYGGPRTAVLARRLQEAGVLLDGLVLQSPAMDYNSNCGATDLPKVSCAGFLPTYAAVGAWHRLTNPVPTDANGWTAQAVSFTDTSYSPAVLSFLANGTTAPTLWQPLADLTGIPVARWQSQFNLGPSAHQTLLLPGQLIGRYDGRMKAALGSALAADGDPSSTWISSSFATANNSYLRDTLKYRNDSTYVLLSNAIDVWDFSHGGLAVPDTIPDLSAALAQNARMRVLAVSGYHDLATPFHLTETDLARIGSSRVKVRNYAGGHMSYLDDISRPLQRADLMAFYAEAIAARAPSSMAMRKAQTTVRVDSAGTPQQPGSVAPTHEPAFQAPMREPWVPGIKPR